MKPDLKTRSSRRFFRIFNDASFGRLIAISGIGLGVPAITAGIALDRDASPVRGPQGAAHAAQYSAEIKAIAAAMSRETFKNVRDSADLARMPAQDFDLLMAQRRKAEQLSVRITFDTQISEKDAENLAGDFFRAVGERYITPLMGEVVRDQYSDLYRGASYLEEARKKMPPAPPSTWQSRQVLIAASKAEVNNQLGICFAPAIIFAFAGTPFLAAALRKGTQKNDKNRQQERNEVFGEKKKELEDLLKPKSSAPKPKGP